MADLLAVCRFQSAVALSLPVSALAGHKLKVTSTRSLHAPATPEHECISSVKWTGGLGDAQPSAIAAKFEYARWRPRAICKDFAALPRRRDHCGSDTVAVHEDVTLLQAQSDLRAASIKGN